MYCVASEQADGFFVALRDGRHASTNLLHLPADLLSMRLLQDLLIVMITIIKIVIIIIINGLMNHDCGIYLRQYDKF